MAPVRISSCLPGGGLAARAPLRLGDPLRLCAILLVFLLALTVLLARPDVAGRRGEWHPLLQTHAHRIKSLFRSGKTRLPARSGLQRLQESCEILEAGRWWYRHGQPFTPIPLRRVAFGFNAASLGDPSLLFYGQLLNGLFRGSQMQYIAVMLKNGGLTVNMAQSTDDGDSFVSNLSVPKQIKAGTWYLVCLTVLPTLALQVVEADTAIKHNRGMWKGCKWNSTTAIASPATRLPESNKFVIDSGLYFAAVVDVRNSPGLTGEPHLGAFRGQILRNLVLNKAEVNLSTENRGPPAENWEGSLSGLNLTQTITTNLTKVRTPLNGVSFQKFPIVSSVSQNHAEEIHDMLASVVQTMPERGIIVYDMGLRGNSSEVIASFCNVTIRQYRRDLFPQLLQHLFHYRWKAPLIYGAFMEFGGVIWADASTRFRYQLQHLPLVPNGYGFVGLTEKGVSPVGSFTHDGTLTALGVPRSLIKLSDMTITGVTIWLGTGGVCMPALENWVRCSFVKECMAPEGTKKDYHLCRMKEKPFGNFIGCHRFDQSALSIILAKIFAGRSTSDYLELGSKLLIFRRWRTVQFPRCYSIA